MFRPTRKRSLLANGPSLVNKPLFSAYSPFCYITLSLSSGKQLALVNYQVVKETFICVSYVAPGQWYIKGKGI